MTLYDIKSEMLNCIDAETGEVIDVEKLEALELEKEQKFENVALWIKNMEAENAAINAEIDTLNSRVNRNKKKIESLKNWLVYALDGEKFSTAKCEIRWRRSESVYIPDETKIAKKYFKKETTYKLDKQGIKELLKSGVKVKGAELVQKQNPQIK